MTRLLPLSPPHAWSHARSPFTLLMLAWLMAAAGCGRPAPGAPPPARGQKPLSGTPVAVATACAEAGARVPLDDYVRRADPYSASEPEPRRSDAEGTLVDLDLVTQRWQGIEWRHRLRVHVPRRAPPPDLALLVLRDGEPGAGDDEALRAISRATATSAAFLYQIPNQPLLDGREEDELLAHTFSRYLQTGDESWPLLLPMTKSVVRSMDAMEALRGMEGGGEIARFVVAGHSKRGHTAWLAGVADPRVKGILPLAIDVLNSPAQIAHHRTIAGEITGSSAVFEETVRVAGTERGRCLLEMIDPYVHRARLTEPKLIVLGTADDYAPTGGLDLYWDGLPGDRAILYLPNTSHAGVNSHPDVNPTAFAFTRAVAAGSTLPSVESSVQVVADGARLRVQSDGEVRSAGVWTATSADGDFRASVWTRREIPDSRRSATPTMHRIEDEVMLAPGVRTAILAELEFAGGGAPFKLTTRLHILDPPAPRGGN